MMVFKCDRCGAIYERTYDYEINNSAMIGFMDNKGKFQWDSRYDLCPDCIEKLIFWIEGEKK